MEVKLISRYTSDVYSLNPDYALWNTRNKNHFIGDRQQPRRPSEAICGTWVGSTKEVLYTIDKDIVAKDIEGFMTILTLGEITDLKNPIDICKLCIKELKND